MRFAHKLRRLRVLLLENATFRQTIFKNTFWLTVSNLGGRIIRAFLLIYVARVLGTAGYGVFSYAVGLAAFFSIFSDIGVAGMLTREGAKRPEMFPEYIGTSVVLKVILLVFTNIILFAAIPFVINIPEAIPLLPLAALLITFDGLRDLVFSVTRAKEKMELEAAINIATNLAITGIGIVLIFLRPTPFHLMAGYTAGSAIGTVIAFILLRAHFRGFWRHVNRSLMWPIIREGFPFALAGLLGSIMINTDMVMLGWLSNKEAVGLYSAAQRPVQILYLVPNIMAIALFPSFARLAKVEPERFRSLFERAVSFAILVALPMTVGGMLLSGDIVTLLFGNEFRPASTAFMALLVTLLMSYPAQFLSNAVFAHNEQKALSGFLALGALSNFVLNYLFIPRWGILGCAIATILAQLLSDSFVWWKVKRLTSFHLLRHLAKIFLAAAAMGVMVYGLDRAGVHVILNIILSGTAYFAILFLLREKILLHFTPLITRVLKGTAS